MRIKVKEVAIILYDHSEIEDVEETTNRMLSVGYRFITQGIPVIAPYQNKIVMERDIETTEDSRLYEVKPRYKNK